MTPGAEADRLDRHGTVALAGLLAELAGAGVGSAGGLLLGELERRPGERTDQTSSNVGQGSPYKEALDEAGATCQDASRWKKVAGVPEGGE